MTPGDWRLTSPVVTPDYEPLRAAARERGLGMHASERRELAAALDGAIGILERAVPRGRSGVVTLTGQGGDLVSTVTVSVVWAP